VVLVNNTMLLPTAAYARAWIAPTADATADMTAERGLATRTNQAMAGWPTVGTLTATTPAFDAITMVSQRHANAVKPSRPPRGAPR
jgi:hypothetical protein